jgi:hypothetical protein
LRMLYVEVNTALPVEEELTAEFPVAAEDVG